MFQSFGSSSVKDRKIFSFSLFLSLCLNETAVCLLRMYYVIRECPSGIALMHGRSKRQHTGRTVIVVLQYFYENVLAKSGFVSKLFRK